jgi:rubrerythrin
MNNATSFFCKACGHKWKGMFIPLYCPNCETVRQIAIDITEEWEED